jgi:hypothetical protein
LVVIALILRPREVPRDLDDDETFCGVYGVGVLGFSATALSIRSR